jgi:hypothetical protein
MATATKQKRPPRPIISRSIGDAAGQTVLDAIDAGFTIDEIIGPDDRGPKTRPIQKHDQEALDQMVSLSSRGGPVAGQSLTNDPEQPKPWEKPPTFSNPREALMNISKLILQPEAIKGTVGALVNGAAVADIATAILYANFTEGDISPDTMLLLMEPVMYLIMSIGEEANIKYNIEGDDLDEFDDEDPEDPEEVEEKINEFKNVFEKIKNAEPVKSVNKEKLNINSNILPKSILEKVQEKGPEIQSILNRQQQA